MDLSLTRKWLDASAAKRAEAEASRDVAPAEQPILQSVRGDFRSIFDAMPRSMPDMGVVYTQGIKKAK